MMTAFCPDDIPVGSTFPSGDRVLQVMRTGPTRTLVAVIVRTANGEPSVRYYSPTDRVTVSTRSSRPARRLAELIDSVPPAPPRLVQRPGLSRMFTRDEIRGQIGRAHV